MQTSADWVGYHTSDILMGKKTTIADDQTAIAQVTLADITRVAHDYLRPSSWYLALCGDLESNEIQFAY